MGTEDTGRLRRMLERSGLSKPQDERARLQALERLAILDTDAEEAFDGLVQLAARLCRAPIALVSLVDRDRAWFKARVGLDTEECPRAQAFCSHAIATPDELTVVPDAANDARFRANPLVTGDAHFRFYAGAPLVTSDGQAVGTLCVIDREPRGLDAEQAEALRTLADQVVAQLALRVELQRSAERQQAIERANLRLVVDSLTDPLTGIANRRAMEQRIEAEIERRNRLRVPLSLALIDVDQFKAYNDAFGHPAGDAALVQVAQRLARSVRDYDLVARWGGEEFAILLPDLDIGSATSAGERLRIAVGGADWPLRALTVSVGIATCEAGYGPLLDAARLIAVADAALYAAKAAGRDRVTMLRAGDEAPAAGADSGDTQRLHWRMLGMLRRLARNR